MRRYLRPRIVFDMSSVMWTCLSVGKDEKGFEVYNADTDKTDWINTAEYGFERALNSMLHAMQQAGNLTPIDTILVFEGVNTKSRRLMIHPEYKRDSGKRTLEAVREFDKLKAMLQETFKVLGGIAVCQDNVEADDVIAWLCANARSPMHVRSNDSDLAALSGVNKHGAVITTLIGKEVDHNPFGVFPNEYISLYKAMVGDTRDKIKGIPGFGPKAWMDFHAQFGEAGMAEMVRLGDLGSLHELQAEADENKLVGAIYERREDFLRSWKLAKLRTDWVDTMSDWPVWNPGMVYGQLPQPDTRLKSWQAKRKLVTFSTWEPFRAWFLDMATARPWLALDIETSSADESDDWLAAQGNPDGVDVIGSTTTGLSMTFGDNMQYTVYISFDHADTDNVPRECLLQLLKDLKDLGVEVVIQNTAFEGPVLWMEFGEQLKDNGFAGFIPNWCDTKLEASYVNENEPLGLKKLSKAHLGYDQVDYNTTTTILVEDGVQSVGRFKGKVTKQITPARWETNEDGVEFLAEAEVTKVYDSYQLKMNQLSAKHVFDYACDDTITTAALHNFFQLVMELEGSIDQFYKIETDSSYLHAQSFTHGTDISLPALRELAAEDDKDHAEAWKIVAKYLEDHGWSGTVCPEYSELTAANVKEAFLIVTGKQLETKVRLVEKLLQAVEATGERLMLSALQTAASGNFEDLNKLVKSKFSGEPDFNIDSSTQKCRLLYEVMGLPVRVRNKPTDAMKDAGQKEGNPKADNLAISYALSDAGPAEAEVLKALRICSMVATRHKLYYKPYPNFVHWRTGKVHSSHNQCATNTRRASSSTPNVQQVSKNEKVEGYSPRVREVYIPHKKRAVVVSMDFKAQELRVIGDYSCDPNMLACFIGDNKKDMHALTGVGIFNSRNGLAWSYEDFVLALDDRNHPMYAQVKKSRSLGKLTNFTTEFGAAAPKLAQTLMVTESEAQDYIDAKEAAFPVVGEWKDRVIEEARKQGWVASKCGVRRHLRSLLLSRDRYVSSKAERQAVNFEVQGSSAEMTKLAEGRMWERKLEQRFDCKIIAAIHDEIVVSVAIDDLFEFIPEMHWCMVQPYGNMFVPIESSISFGWSFGPAHQIEIGDKPSKEAIEAGLKELLKEEEVHA